MHQARNHRERLVAHVQELERLEALKKLAADDFKAGLQRAKQEGFDPTTLKVVLRLRKMTSEERRERKALEAIYMAALGMLEGDPLPDEARKRLDPVPDPAPAEPSADAHTDDEGAPADVPATPQPALPLKTPEEARAEGKAAAAAGQRIYDNPYPAGDPCRAAWDEGWCAQSRSHGMDTPAAYQRRGHKKSGEPDRGPGDASDGGQA